MTLAEAFDVRVVAEGIETQRQRDVLRNAGCRFGQGYYYARALSSDELAALYPAVFGLTPKHASA
jgi:EAL domain-containing protein (putative c-di-GMP-specific phosphodiesterase class I)